LSWTWAEQTQDDAITAQYFNPFAAQSYADLLAAVFSGFLAVPTSRHAHLRRRRRTTAGHPSSRVPWMAESRRLTDASFQCYLRLPPLSWLAPAASLRHHASWAEMAGIGAASSRDSQAKAIGTVPLLVAHMHPY
jgi:hypothetical protein